MLPKNDERQKYKMHLIQMQKILYLEFTFYFYISLGVYEVIG